MASYINSFILFMILLPANGNSPAQSSKPKQAEKHFEGIWVDKKTTRHLEISFKDGYAIIIDWTGKFQKRESGDSYKAFLKMENSSCLKTQNITPLTPDSLVLSG